MLDAQDDNGMTALSKIRKESIKRQVLDFERSLRNGGNDEEDNICTDILKGIWSLIFGSGKKKKITESTVEG